MSVWCLIALSLSLSPLLRLNIQRLMHPEFKIQEIFANPINKVVHNTTLFIRFASLEGNISCILNPVCIN